VSERERERENERIRESVCWVFLSYSCSEIGGTLYVLSHAFILLYIYTASILYI